MNELVSEVELGPKMAALSPMQRKFVWAYLMNGGNGADAARKAGYSDVEDGAKVRAHELLHRDTILEAFHEVSWQNMRGMVLAATLTVNQVMQTGNPKERLAAAFGVLNRAGFGEKTTIQHQHSGSIELSHTDAALEALSYLKSMQVPREKLVEQFGHSGLARYEKMLEERDAKRGMRVIDAPAGE